MNNYEYRHFILKYSRDFNSQTAWLLYDEKQRQEIKTNLSQKDMPHYFYYAFELVNAKLCCSKNMKKYLGLNDEELTFDKVHSSYHPEDSGQVLRWAAVALELAKSKKYGDGFGIIVNQRFVAKDGKVIFVERKSSVEYSKFGEPYLQYSWCTILNEVKKPYKPSLNIFYPPNTPLDQINFAKDFLGIDKVETLVNLTAKELEVCRLLRQGHTRKSAAKHLNISKEGVKFHINNMFRKLNVNKTLQIIAYAIRNGLI